MARTTDAQGRSTSQKGIAPIETDELEPVRFTNDVPDLIFHQDGAGSGGAGASAGTIPA